MSPNTKKLIGAIVAAALAIAVYYGLIGQQTATNFQTQANQTLGTTSAAQQPVTPGQPTTTPTAPTAPTTTAPTTTPAPQPAVPTRQ